jgi:hypothetical protein
MTNPRGRYLDASQAMQSGVAMKMNYDPSETSPKSLRVGVNSALVDSGALIRLLIVKGIITEAEYLEVVADGMEREATSYRDELRSHFGNDGITLA